MLGLSKKDTTFLLIVIFLTTQCSTDCDLKPCLHTVCDPIDVLMKNRKVKSAQHTYTLCVAHARSAPHKRVLYQISLR